MITAEEISKIRQQVTTKQVKKGKVTADTVAYIRQQMTPPEPGTTQPAQPVTQPTPQPVTQLAQPEAQTVVQPTQTVAQPRVALINNNIGQDLRTQIEAQAKASMPTVTEWQKNYAEAVQEANKELQEKQGNIKGRDVSNYSTLYEKAREEKDAKNIIKYKTLKENAEKQLTENIQNNKENYKFNGDFTAQLNDINLLKNELAREQETLQYIIEKGGTKDQIAKLYSNYEKTKNELNEKINEYQDNLAYDKAVNKNIVADSAKSFGANVLGGTANIINAAATGTSKIVGNDATNINAEDLLNYKGEHKVTPADFFNLKGMSKRADQEGAFRTLEQLAKSHPNSHKINALYEDIKNQTYTGNIEQLKKDLDDAQKEIYQDFKNKVTQDDLDRVKNQQMHNEVYGDLAIIPNAFGTVGNMVPSILAGVATGGIAEQLGGGAMATAGTVANRAQQVGSMGTLGAGAFSSGLDQALQEGASYNQALNYGVLSGATEVGTEMLGGEAVNKFLGQQGKTALGKLFGKAIDTLNIESKVGRIIANTVSDVAGESTEEMISEAINPLWKAITYDKDALPKNREEVRKYIKDIFNAGIEAIPSTLIMQGAGIGSNVVKTQQIENGIIRSIQDSDLSQIVKNQLVDEVRKASTDVKLGLEEADTMQTAVNQKATTLAAQSEQMKQRIPQGYTLPQSTIDILAYTESNRPGLNINFDTNIQGNGTFVENSDGTRTITLNPNSQRAVEFTLTHELGHDLKGTQEYTQLQNLLEDYAKGKPKYTESLRALEQTYQKSGANFNLKDEAINDMLGSAIGEQEFYNKLAENPTLFERVTNGLKNLLGNKETKLKNKIEKLTSNALKQEYRGKQEGTQQSLSEKSKQLEIIQKSNPMTDDYHTGIRTIDDIKTYQETVENEDERILNPDYTADMVQKALDSGKITVYSSYPIENGVFVTPSKMEAQNYAGSNQVYSKEVNLDDVAWIDSIEGQYAKAQNEAPTQDNQGRELSKGQQEYFKDSKVRDENGNLKVVYHGTDNGLFTIFHRYSFFTDSKDVAKTYSRVFNDREDVTKDYLNIKRSYPVYSGNYVGYLNMTNPFELDVESVNWDAIDIDKVEIPGFNIDELLQREGISYYSSDGKRLVQTDDIISLIDSLNENGDTDYDGIIIKNVYDGGVGGDWNGVKANDYILFEPNQFKSIDNLNPTSNPDIRYSLSEDNSFRETAPITYTLNKKAIQDIADKIGTDYSSVEANIGSTINDAKSYLSRNNRFIENYAKEKNIPVTKAKEPVNFFRLYKPAIQQFVKENNLDVKTLANNPELVEKFLDIYIGEGAEDSKKTWRNLFDFVKDSGDIPSPLRVVDREMQYIRDGITEIERNDISNEQAYNIYKSKEFQNYLDNYLQSIFDKHEYTVDEVMEEAKENHGTTDDYGLGAYMTPDGELLNFNYGGYRDDHRSINAFGMSMQDFMDFGAIRMKPEGNGFEIAVEPTEAQYSRLADYIENYLKGNGDIYVDIDTAKGHDDIGKGYVEDTPTERIINDIKTYFRTGVYPTSRYAFSKSNASWQDFLDKNLNLAQGTKTNFERLPTNQELIQNESKSVENEPILAESLTKSTKNEQNNKITVDRPLEEMRSFKKVGDRKVNAYQYENPEVKPFFQFEAKLLLDDLKNATKGEKWLTDDNDWSGTKRAVTQDIAELLDGEYGVKLKYDDIRNGLEAIIKDNGAENIAAAKRIEMVLDKRLREGYTDSLGYEHDPSDNYKKFLNGEDYIPPQEYANQQMYERYGNPEDETLFSLSEQEQKEVNDFADKLFDDKTLDERFVTETYQKLNRIKNYSDFEEIKQEVSDYKDKLYKGISGLEDIANLTPEDARQREMRYTQLKDKNTGNQRRFFDNMETSPIIAEDTKNRVNATTYETRHNLDTLEQMKDRLDERGNKLVEEWKMKSKNFTDKDVALGAILIERYQQEGDWDSAARAVEKLADMGTEAGRAVQMYSIFQRLSPETMAIYQQKALNQAFEEMKKRQTGKWVEKNQDKFKLTADETQFIYDQVEKASQAIDEETKQRELSKIENMINNKLPPEKGAAIKTLRRLAMLFNPKTQVRNIVGNTLIMPVNDVADFIGTGIDRLISKKTGVRTTSTANLKEKGQGFARGIRQAVKDYKTGTRTTATGNKYEFEIGAKPFSENTNSKVRNAINTKLNGLNDLLSAVMSGGDRPFYEAAYRNSLQGQMRANNVTEPTQDMIDIASNEALQRTWNDDNEYTKTVLGIRKALNKANIGGFGLGDLIIPFAKTPANLTKAMVEYSPAGFIESVIDFNDMRKAISRGEMTPQQQKKFVTSMSKAISGTLLYLIGGTLAAASKVRITGSADDDKDVKNFEQNVLGIQPYSVVIGDKSYTYSWANPINAPLAIMADTYKMSKENASTWDILNNAFKVAGETLVDNSFLSGIKELFSKDSISEGLVDAVESFPESLVPTFISQIASLGDKTQRQTFEYNNDLGTITNKIKNKTPGLRNTLAPQVNTFGEEIENQNNVFNAFLNPANVREARVTESQKALYDVYQETKDKTIFPMQAPYYVSIDGEKKNLTSKDRVDYQKASGQYVNEVYDDLFNQDAFNKAHHVGNEGKVEILKQIASDGNTKGKEAVGATTQTTDILNEKIDMLQDAEIPLADYYLTWYAQKNQKGKQAKKTAISQTIDYINEGDHKLDREQKNLLYEIFNVN